MRAFLILAALLVAAPAFGQARGEVKALYPDFTIEADNCQSVEVMVLGGGAFADIAYECSFFQYHPTEWEKGCPPDEVSNPSWVSKLTLDGPGLEHIHTEDCEMVVMEVLDDGRPDRLRYICLDGASISHCSGDVAYQPRQSGAADSQPRGGKPKGGD